MQSQYYVVRANGSKEGPFDEATVRQMVATGQIISGDKLEDAETGSIWEPSVFSPGPSFGAPEVKTRKVSPLVWVLVGLCAVCLPCIAVFAALLFPVFSQANVAAKMTRTMSTLKSTGIAVSLYQTDFDDKFPPKMDNVSSAWPYIRSYAKAVDVPQSMNSLGAEFNGNSGLAGQPVTKITAPQRTFVFFDSSAWQNNKRIVLYADTSVKKIAETQFQQAMLNKMVDQ